MHANTDIIEACHLLIDWMMDNPDALSIHNRGALQDGLNGIASEVQDEENQSNEE